MFSNEYEKVFARVESYKHEQSDEKELLLSRSNFWSESFGALKRLRENGISDEYLCLIAALKQISDGEYSIILNGKLASLVFDNTKFFIRYFSEIAPNELNDRNVGTIIFTPTMEGDIDGCKYISSVKGNLINERAVNKITVDKIISVVNKEQRKYYKECSE
ncbi:MAG: hypothetical protein HWE27_14045 [Gammaproteobacteria bacterium]|nr:hypothetical protein [Gammaproteobacteria bacterium]